MSEPKLTDADVNWRDWHIEGDRRGDGWAVRATHLPTGESWLALDCGSFDLGRAECVKAITEKLARRDVVGRLRIDWPPASTALTGWQVQLYDADSGEDVGHRTLRMTIDAEAGRIVHADLTMLVDADHAPTDRPVVNDGGVATAVFRWAVAEVRTAEATR